MNEAEQEARRYTLPVLPGTASRKKNAWPSATVVLVVLAGVSALVAGTLLYYWPAKVVTNEMVMKRLETAETTVTKLENAMKTNADKLAAAGNLISDAVNSIDPKIQNKSNEVKAELKADQEAYEVYSETKAGKRDVSREAEFKEMLDAMNRSIMTLKETLATCGKEVHGLEWKLNKTETVLTEQFFARSNASLDEVKSDMANVALQAHMNVTRLSNDFVDVQARASDVLKKQDEMETRINMADEKAMNITETVHALASTTKALAKPMAAMFGGYLWTFMLFAATNLVLCLGCWALIALHQDHVVEELASKHLVLLSASHAKLAAPGPRRGARGNAGAGAAAAQVPAPAAADAEWTKVWTTLLIQASPIIMCFIAFFGMAYLMTHPVTLLRGIASL